MISRPTTDQLIADVCQDLVDAVLPALTDETLQVRVAMAETVLRNAAVRAAHEIAWMSDETAALIEYAKAVNARIPSVELTATLAAFDDGATAQPASRGRRRDLRASESGVRRGTCCGAARRDSGTRRRCAGSAP